MVTQSTDYSTISSTVLQLFYSKLGPLDEYIIMRTDEDEYTMLVRKIPSGTVTEYVCTRVYASSSWGSSYYDITSSSGDFDYSVSNEFYVYSNVGLGTMDILPVHEIMTSFACVSLCCLIFLAVMFKGALFKICRK